MLFIISVQFLRGRWLTRIFCFISGGFAANAIVLTRSRGAFLGVAAGCLAAILMAPKKFRLVIMLGLLLAGAGIYALMDTGSIKRVDTISADTNELDDSARSRIEIWRGGFTMLLRNPLGVGPGNFYQRIGNYAPDHPGRDAHNTLVRCGGELGFAGLIIFLMLLCNAVLTVMKCRKMSNNLPPGVKEDIQLAGYGSITALAAMLGYGMTGTLTYTEFLWWMIMIPVCVHRTLATEMEALHIGETDVKVEE
jgi:putative inorganic carbon (hco3(-)) transporter